MINTPLDDASGVFLTRLLTKMMNKEEVEEKTIILPYGIEEKGSTK